jgi:uncharacterized membrane protein YgcG
MQRLALALALLAAGTAAATERILSFDSRIEVRPDSALEVNETIIVNAEGNQIRRGIFREFPTIYSRADGSRKTVGFEVLSVRRNGVKESYHLERRVNGIAVYVGDKDHYLSPGEYRYELRYRTDRQLGFFADHDELYWNVTGNGWAFPIEQARARVVLPSAVSIDSLRLEAYTGSQGSHAKNYTARVEDGAAQFETTKPLGVQQGLTIVVTWPKGFVLPPGDVATAGYLLRDNAPVACALGVLLFVAAFYTFIWKRVGRDPPKGVVIPQYRPPAGESPASMRYIELMGYDNRCFAAAIVSLAVKGHLVIEQEPGRFLHKSRYVLTRVPGSTTPLSADELAVLGELFTAGDSLLLNNESASTVLRAKRVHQRALQDRSEPGFRLNRGWRSLGTLVTLAAIALGVIWPARAGGFGLEWLFITPGGWTTAAVTFGILMVGVPFARLLPAPTVAGRKLMDEIEGFRLYLSVAEGDELKLAGAPRKTPQLFEAYLPFALALGVSQLWSQQFAEVFRVHAQAAAAYSPQWYQGDSWDVDDVGSFATAFSSSFESAIAAASTAPGDSSGSGSSGGGSSGGGGGGGGGGGW